MKKSKITPYTSNRMSYIINLINPGKNQKILNIGVSNIPEIEMLLENQVKECWTIDFDKNKLKKASPYLKKTRLIEADITKPTNLPKNYFDTIVAIEVLEHLKDDVQALKWISSLLKKGGKIVVGVPNDHFLHYFNPVKYAEHERHYSNKLIRERLIQTGFKIEHFNLVETWALLPNLYIHLFLKFILRMQRPFGIFRSGSDNSYKKLNNSGMDILILASKIN